MIDEAAADTPRWVQRFGNFDGALMLLREGIDVIGQPGAHPMLREGLIQRFEFTFELAWKTLKDFLEFRKVTLDRRGPADVLKMAFATGYIAQGQTWLDALDARNEMSHVYRRQAFERVVGDIRDRFWPAIEELHEMLLTERIKLDGG